MTQKQENKRLLKDKIYVILAQKGSAWNWNELAQQIASILQAEKEREIEEIFETIEQDIAIVTDDKGIFISGYMAGQKYQALKDKHLKASKEAKNMGGYTQLGEFNTLNGAVTVWHEAVKKCVDEYHLFFKYGCVVYHNDYKKFRLHMRFTK